MGATIYTVEQSTEADEMTEKQLIAIIGVLAMVILGFILDGVKENTKEIKNNFKEISGLSARIAKVEP